MNKKTCIIICQFILLSGVSLHAQNFIAVSTNTSAGQPNSVAVADVNGDNRLDLISPDYNDSAVLVFTNQGGGRFSPAASYFVPGNPYWVAAADVNGDGKVDVISANANGNTLTILTNNGGGISARTPLTRWASTRVRSLRRISTAAAAWH